MGRAILPLLFLFATSQVGKSQDPEPDYNFAPRYLCGNLTLIEIWNDDLKDNTSEAFRNLEGILLLDILEKGDVPELDDIEFRQFKILGFDQISADGYDVIANYLVYLGMPADGDTEVVKNLLTSLNIVNETTMINCSDKVIAEIDEGLNYQDEDQASYHNFYGTATLTGNFTWNDILNDNSSEEYLQWKDDLEQPVEDKYGDYLPEGGITHFRTDNGVNVVAEFSGILKVVPDHFDENTLQEGMNDMDIFQSVTITKTDEIPDYSPEEDMLDGKHVSIFVEFVDLEWIDHYEDTSTNEYKHLVDVFQRNLSEATGFSESNFYGIQFHMTDSYIVEGECKMDIWDVNLNDLQNDLDNYGAFQNIRVAIDEDGDYRDEEEHASYHNFHGTATLAGNFTWNDILNDNSSEEYQQWKDDLEQPVEDKYGDYLPEGGIDYFRTDNGVNVVAEFSGILKVVPDHFDENTLQEGMNDMDIFQSVTVTKTDEIPDYSPEDDKLDGKHVSIFVEFVGLEWIGHYEDTSANEYKYLADVFQRNLSEATGISQSNFYDIQFHMIDSYIVEGECKIHVSDVSLDDLQHDLDNYGAFHNARVEIIKGDYQDEEEHASYHNFYGSATLAGNFTWNDILNDNSSEEYQQWKDDLEQPVEDKYGDYLPEGGIDYFRTDNGVNVVAEFSGILKLVPDHFDENTLQEGMNDMDIFQSVTVTKTDEIPDYSPEDDKLDGKHVSIFVEIVGLEWIGHYEDTSANEYKYLADVFQRNLSEATDISQSNFYDIQFHMTDSYIVEGECKIHVSDVSFDDLQHDLDNYEAFHNARVEIIEGDYRDEEEHASYHNFYGSATLAGNFTWNDILNDNSSEEYQQWKDDLEQPVEDKYGDYLPEGGIDYFRTDNGVNVVAEFCGILKVVPDHFDENTLQEGMNDMDIFQSVTVTKTDEIPDYSPEDDKLDGKHVSIFVEIVGLEWIGHYEDTSANEYKYLADVFQRNLSEATGISQSNFYDIQFHMTDSYIVEGECKIHVSDVSLDDLQHDLDNFEAFHNARVEIIEGDYRDEEEHASYHNFYGSATLAGNFTWNDILNDNSSEEYQQWKDDLEQPVEDKYGDYLPEGGIDYFRTDNGVNVVAEFSGILKVVPDHFDENTLQEGMNDMDIFQSVTVTKTDEIPDYSPEDDKLDGKHVSIFVEIVGLEWIGHYEDTSANEYKYLADVFQRNLSEATGISQSNFYDIQFHMTDSYIVEGECKIHVSDVSLDDLQHDLDNYEAFHNARVEIIEGDYRDEEEHASYHNFYGSATLAGNFTWNDILNDNSSEEYQQWKDDLEQPVEDKYGDYLPEGGIDYFRTDNGVNVVAEFSGILKVVPDHFDENTLQEGMNDMDIFQSVTVTKTDEIPDYSPEDDKLDGKHVSIFVEIVGLEWIGHYEDTSANEYKYLADVFQRNLSEATGISQSNFYDIQFHMTDSYIVEGECKIHVSDVSLDDLQHDLDNYEAFHNARVEIIEGDYRDEEEHASYHNFYGSATLAGNFTWNDILNDNSSEEYQQWKDDLEQPVEDKYGDYLPEGGIDYFRTDNGVNVVAEFSGILKVVPDHFDENTLQEGMNDMAIFQSVTVTKIDEIPDYSPEDDKLDGKHVSIFVEIVGLEWIGHYEDTSANGYKYLADVFQRNLSEATGISQSNFYDIQFHMTDSYIVEGECKIHVSDVSLDDLQHDLDNYEAFHNARVEIIEGDYRDEEEHASYHNFYGIATLAGNFTWNDILNDNSSEEYQQWKDDLEQPVEDKYGDYLPEGGIDYFRTDNGVNVVAEFSGILKVVPDHFDENTLQEGMNDMDIFQSVTVTKTDEIPDYSPEDDKLDGKHVSIFVEIVGLEWIGHYEDTSANEYRYLADVFQRNLSEATGISQSNFYDIQFHMTDSYIVEGECKIHVSDVSLDDLQHDLDNYEAFHNARVEIIEGDYRDEEEHASYHNFYGIATLAGNFTWNDILNDNSSEEYQQWKDDLEQPVEDKYGDYLPEGGIDYFRTDNGVNVVAEFSGILNVVPDHFDENTLQEGMNDMDIFQSVTVTKTDEIPDYSPEDDKLDGKHVSIFVEIVGLEWIGHYEDTSANEYKYLADVFQRNLSEATGISQSNFYDIQFHMTDSYIVEGECKIHVSDVSLDDLQHDFDNYEAFHNARVEIIEGDYRDEEEHASYHNFYGSATLAGNFTWNDILNDNSSEEYQQWKDDLEQPVDDKYGDYLPEGGIDYFRTDNGVNVVAEFSGILKVVPDHFDENTLQEGMNDMDIFQSVTVTKTDEIPDYSPEDDKLDGKHVFIFVEIVGLEWIGHYEDTSANEYKYLADVFQRNLSEATGISQSNFYDIQFHMTDSYIVEGECKIHVSDVSLDDLQHDLDNYEAFHNARVEIIEGDYRDEEEHASYHNFYGSATLAGNFTWNDILNDNSSEEYQQWKDDLEQPVDDKYGDYLPEGGIDYFRTDNGVNVVAEFSGILKVVPDHFDENTLQEGMNDMDIFQSVTVTKSDEIPDYSPEDDKLDGKYVFIFVEIVGLEWISHYEDISANEYKYLADVFQRNLSEATGFSQSNFYDIQFHMIDFYIVEGECKIVVSDVSLDDLQHDLDNYGAFHNARVEINEGDYRDEEEHASYHNFYGTATLAGNFTWNDILNDNSSEEFLQWKDDLEQPVEDKYGDYLPEGGIVYFRTDNGVNVVAEFSGVLKVVPDHFDENTLQEGMNDMDIFQSVTITKTDEIQDYSPEDDMLDAWEADFNPEIKSVVNKDEFGVRTWLLSCDFDVVDDFMYKIEWLSDSNILADSGIISADAARSFTFSTNNVINTDPDAFFMENKCRVEVYSYEGNMVYEAESEKIVPIEVDDLNIVRGTDANITLTFNFPLVCQVNDENCYMILKAEFPDDDKSCNRPTPVVKGSSDNCELKVYGNGDDDDIGTQSVIFGIRGDSEQFVLEKSDFEGIVRMQTGSSVVFDVPSSFESTFRVNLIEGEELWKNSNCYVINDARFKTFDGLFYGLTSTSETITLYRNEEKSAEIQITTQPCSDDLPSASCVCAVYIRCGKDVFVVNFCTAPFTSSYVQLEEGSLYVVEESSETYKVYLAHGTSIYVSKVSPFLLDITVITVIIFPAPSEIRQVDGLCGYFDGDKSNDLKHKDDGNTPVSFDDFNWQDAEPTAFADSYRVTSDEALFEESVLANLEHIEGDEKYCTCTDVSEVCSIHEKRTCDNQDTEVVDAPGRRKRSTDLQIFEGQRLELQEISRRMKIWKEQQLQAVSSSRKKRQSTDCTTITIDKARIHCEDILKSMCTEVFLDAEFVLNQSDVIETCARTKTDTCEEQTWEWSTCNAALAVLKNKVLKDNTVSEEDRNSAMQSNIFCPNLCSNNGTCSADGCQCNEGFSEDDCSFNSNNAPTPDLFVVEAIVEISPVNAPTAITISSYSGFSTAATCRLLTITITLPGNSISTFESFFPIVRISLYEAECPIPSSRKRRSTGSGSSNAVTTYEVSASNDGNTYGSSAQINVLDNTCLTYDSGNVTLAANYCLIDGICYMDGDNKTGETCSVCDTYTNVYDWTLENGNCLIDGVCYTNGTTKTGDKCKLCNVDVVTDEWTRDNETDSCKADDDSESSEIAGYIIAIIVLVIVLVLAGGAVGGHFLMNKYKLSKRRSTGLFDTVTKNKFSLRIEPTKKVMLAPDGINIDQEDGNQGYHPKPEQPPPLYVTTNLFMPNAANVAAPDNLYTDRGTTDSLSALNPAMAEDSQRPHTPNMPNIEG